MANIYTEEPSPGRKEVNRLEPKLETVQFLLNYSKALSVIDYKNQKFEALLN